MRNKIIKGLSLSLSLGCISYMCSVHLYRHIQLMQFYSSDLSAIQYVKVRSSVRTIHNKPNDTVMQLCSEMNIFLIRISDICHLNVHCYCHCKFLPLFRKECLSIVPWWSNKYPSSVRKFSLCICERFSAHFFSLPMCLE